MPVTNLVFITKKPGLSFDDFVKYFEDVHLPMMQSRLGDALPKTFRRNYIDPAKPSYVGPDREIHLVLEMTWEDEAGVGRFMEKVREGDNAEVLKGSWDNYCDEKGETVIGTSRTFGH